MTSRVVAVVVGLALVSLAAGWGPALFAALTFAVWRAALHRPARRRGVRRRRVWTDAERRQILERDGWACVQCGSTDELEIDHVIPFSRGGACTVANAQVLCGPCNRAKGAS
jgi:5-methylcytosine-specific restriction endonuclease McrA